MKKYRVIQKGTGAIFGEFENRVQAAKEIMRYLNDLNDGGVVHLSPFDFEEIECDVNEGITDFESAKKYLVGKTNDVFIVDKERFSKSVVKIEKAEKLIKELNPKHIEALVALNRLFTIAEAWNKADGFVPDFSDLEQVKWIPWFKYDKDAAGFVYANTNYTFTHANACIGSRLCFQTKSRAEQFGRQFEELYNNVFL